MVNKPWYRTKGETAKAHEAFKLFLAMPQRTLAGLHRQGFSQRTLEVWSKKHSWRERALAYDNALVDHEDNEIVDHIATVQQVITSAGLDDYARLRKIWDKGVRALEATVEGSVIALAEASASDDFERVESAQKALNNALSQLNTMIMSRAKLETLGRAAAHLPDTYGKKQIAEDTNDVLPDVVELTPTGPKIRSLTSGEDITR